jgi:hypothetical protein
MKYFLLITVTILFISACDTPSSEKKILAGQEIRIDDEPGTCPYLTKDNKGNIVLSWVRNTNDSTSIFCYAVSGDGGRSFGKTIVIPSSKKIKPHSENLPKIIFKPSGEIIALWGEASLNPKNKYAGLVYYSQSFDEGRNWTSSKPLVADTAGYDQRYYDVALLPRGEVAIIWLDNRTTTDKEGSSLFFAVTEGESGFQKEKMISQGCCQCCRTDLFVDNKAGIHVLYRGIIEDSIRDMVHSVSIDDGNSFSAPRLISDDKWVINGCPHTGPAMTENKDGLHFAWFTGGANKGCYYTNSADNGKNFIPRDRISSFGSHPQISSFPDGKLAIVWDETVQVNAAYYKRIGVQIRTSTGLTEKQGFITNDTLTSTYPVSLPLSDRAVVIAYTQKKNEKDYIMCQYAE